MNDQSSSTAAMETDEGYAALERLVGAAIADARQPLFQTTASPEALWETYLENIPADRRQHYNCHCCRRFIQRYGGLVYISPAGNLSTVLWSVISVPDFFRDSVGAVQVLVLRSKVAGVFLSSDKVWGTPKTGLWTHLSGTPAVVHSDRLKTADQAAAEKLEDYKIMVHGLGDYPPVAVDQALRVLRGEAVYRSEKALGVAEWLHELQVRLDGVKGQQRSNLIWLAVATAPPGFCHIRSTIISTLLDDIIAGMPIDAIQRRWAEKLHPLQYQRPTAAPKSGAIEQAEKVVEKLGVAKSFDRRFATLADVQQTLWVNAPIDTEPPKPGGVFDHLKADRLKVAEIDLPAVNMTWEKFRRTVLPEALSIQALIPSQGAFYGLVTASDPEAPAIIQWDGIDGKRNPVSWYFYHQCSTASRWSLSAGQLVNVTAVFLPPYAWHHADKFKHQGEKVFFSLEGCWDIDVSRSGLALFPEILKTEFHSIRSVIEAHSRKGEIKGAKDGTANGLAFQKENKTQRLMLRVRSSSGFASYVLDRWD